MRKLLGNLTLAAVSVLLTLALAEVLLSFMPVTGVARSQPLAADGSGFDVSSVRNGSVTYSDSWAMKNPHVKVTNNYGFFSRYDYKRDASVVLAIGDSYTEAAQVDFEKTYHQRAAAAVGKTVYNLAISGSPLSQYEAYLADACRHFRPTAAAFAIIHNDFDESFREHRARNGFFHYSDADPITLTATPYHISTLRWLVTKSSLVRYVFFNLNMRHHVRQLTSGSAQGHRVAISFSGSSGVDVAVSKRAIDIFLDRIAGYCVPKDKIILMLDGDRQAIYQGIARRDAAMMYFLAQARARGFAVVDLHGVFASNYATEHKVFESATDPHWDLHGHSVVGAALAEVLKDPLYHRKVAQQLGQ